MPIFEYECRDCHQQFEILVRSSTVPECPSCHSHDLEKQLSVFATSASESAAFSQHRWHIGNERMPLGSRFGGRLRSLGKTGQSGLGFRLIIAVFQMR